MNHKILKSTAAVCALSLASGWAIAQTDPSNASPSSMKTAADGTGGLEEVIVTAQKRRQNLSTVGVTISALNAEQLHNAGVTDILHLTNVVSGFTVVTGYEGLPTFSIRGLGFESNQLAASPTVSAYVDEAPLPYPAMTGGVTLDLERVEVLKGPQGTLYGNNSTGGSINFIAAKPTDIFSAGLQTSADRFGQFYVEGFVSGPINDQLKARLAVSTTQGGDWQHTYTPGPRLDSGTANKGAERLLLDWNPMDDLKISLNQNMYYDDSDPQLTQIISAHPAGGPGSAVVVPPYGSIETYPLPPRDDRAADFPARGSRHDRFYQGVLRADLTLTDAFKLTSITNYSHLDEYFNRPMDGTRFPIVVDASAGTIQSYGQEVRLTGDFSSIGLNTILGANYSYDTVSEFQPASYPNFSVLPPGSAFNPHGVFTSQSPAVFANAEWKATDEFTFLAGVRYTLDKQTDFNCLGTNAVTSAFMGGLAGAFRAANGLGPTNAYVPGVCSTVGPPPNYLPFTYNAKSTDHNVSWRVGVNYHLTDEIMPYVVISQGYKAGGYAFQTSLVSPEDSKVQQEGVLSYEAGVKLSLHNKLRFSAAGYYYDYSNKQVFADFPAPVVGTLSELANIPKSKAYGFDAEATWMPTASLLLHAAVTYTRTAITDAGDLHLDPFGAPINYVGHPFPYSPKWSSIFDAEYNLPVTDDLNGFVGASGTYQGSQNGDISTETAYNIDPYLLLDARIGVEAEAGWKATFWVRNLTNKYYWTSTNFGGDAYIKTTGMPRNFGITLSYKFSGEDEAAETATAYTPPPVVAPAPAPKSYLVFFDFNKSDLTPQATEIVDTAAKNAGPSKVTQLTVTGHTDTVGSDAYNMRLSRRRAESVAAQLEKDGIASSEIEIVAKGKRDLLVPTGDGVREPQNRRVQIVYSGGPTS